METSVVPWRISPSPLPPYLSPTHCRLSSQKFTEVDNTATTSLLTTSQPVSETATQSATTHVKQCLVTKAIDVTAPSLSIKKQPEVDTAPSVPLHLALQHSMILAHETPGDSTNEPEWPPTKTVPTATR